MFTSNRGEDTIGIANVPDVVFFSARPQRLYVAIGDPGVIEVLETTPLHRRQVAMHAGAELRR